MPSGWRNFECRADQPVGGRLQIFVPEAVFCIVFFLQLASISASDNLETADKGPVAPVRRFYGKVRMKATERQQLTHNELAEAMLQWWTQVKPYLAYVLIGVLVVGVAIFFGVQSSQHKKAEEVRSLIAFLPSLNGQGGEPLEQVNSQIAGLEGFLRQFPTSSLVPAAKLGLANRYYARAIVAWAEPAGKAGAAYQGDFQKAQELYEKLAGRNDEIGLEAKFGLASVAAELGEQDPVKKEAAKEQFLALAKENPNTLIEIRANERLKILREAKPLEFAPEVPVLKSSAAPSGAAAVKAPAAQVGSGGAAVVPPAAKSSEAKGPKTNSPVPVKK